MPNRNVDTAYVIIYEDRLEIYKESVWIKTNMGSRKLYFSNIASIDYDARGVFHASSSAIINTKSAEHVQLKFVSQENYNLMNNAFSNYLDNLNKPAPRPIQNTTINKETSNADELLKYADLFERGYLTKEEFEAKKKELL